MMYDIFHSAMFSDLDDISYAGLVIESMLGWLLTSASLPGRNLC